ncbi:MAG: type II secretion system protein GspM [Pseudomonadota bacterium]|jgi:general secretion pathway protein M|nr:type II secretion system protein GspM [Pseudomonadota bacterium]
MSAWWNNMAPRERLLIAIAGALTAIIVVWQFMLVPSLDARAEAKARLHEADRTLAQIQEQYGLQRARGAAAPNDARPTSASIDDFKAAITGAAGDIGLSIARLQGNDTTSVRLVFEDVDPRLIFLWLESVQANHSGQVTRFNMEQSGGGLVRVSVDLVAGGL